MSSLTMLGAFAAVAIAVLITKAVQDGKKRKAGEYRAAVQKETTDAIVDACPDAKDVFIAGLAHRCTSADAGLFTGFVYNEKTNTANHMAMAVWDNRTQKVIGYVPEAVLEEYWAFCGGKRCRCVGYIYFDGERFRGRVRSYLPDVNPNEDMEKYTSQVSEHFGWKRP